MKYFIIVSIIFFGLISINFIGAQESGLALSVKPGMMINAAHIGYKTGSLFAGFGLEFGSMSLETKVTDTVADTSYISSEQEVTIFLPQLGTRIFLGSELGEGTGARPYIWLSAFYSLAMTRVTSGGVSDTVEAQRMRDLLGGNIGGSIAFGGEYSFSSNFSIGGEFGVRLLFGGTKETSAYSRRIYEDRLGLGVTYTAMGLNFYF